MAKSVTLAELGDWASRANGDMESLNLQEPLKQCAGVIASHLKKTFGAGTSPDGTPFLPIRGFRQRATPFTGKPLQRDGLLMASITAQAHANQIVRASARELVFGTNLEYAGIHQEGGTITPKTGKALSIPMSPEAYRAGSARNFGRALRLVWPKGRRSGWLVEDLEAKGKGTAKSVTSKNAAARTILHYLLVPKVTIPARPFLGFNDQMLDDCGLVLLDFVEKKLSE